MQKNGKHLNPVHKASEAQKKHIKKIGKGHFARTALLTASIIILSHKLSFGQSKDIPKESKGKPVPGLVEENKNQLAMLDKNESDVSKKEIGKDFEFMKLKDGVLTLINVKILNTGEYATITWDIGGLNKDAKERGETTQFPENTKPTYVFGVRLNEIGIGTYFIYDDGSINAFFKGEKGVGSTSISSLDGSKVFTHEGAIFIAPNGSIVATTHSTLLVITPNDILSVTYESLFGKIPPLKRPTITGGRNPDEVFIRDETMMSATDVVRLALNLKTLGITVEDDRLALLGSR